MTIAQFQNFLDNNPDIKKNAAQDSSKNPSIANKKVFTFSPDFNCPQILMTWYEAAQYCNWLSKIEEIPESEWVYPKNEAIKKGMSLPKDYLKKKGYRHSPEDCTNSFPGNSNPKACETFCDCIYNKGKPFDKCLEV